MLVWMLAILVVGNGVTAYVGRNRVPMPWLDASLGEKLLRLTWPTTLLFVWPTYAGHDKLARQRAKDQHGDAWRRRMGWKRSDDRDEVV